MKYTRFPNIYAKLGILVPNVDEFKIRRTLHVARDLEAHVATLSDKEARDAIDHWELTSPDTTVGPDGYVVKHPNRITSTSIPSFVGQASIDASGMIGNLYSHFFVDMQDLDEEQVRSIHSVILAFQEQIFDSAKVELQKSRPVPIDAHVMDRLTFKQIKQKERFDIELCYLAALPNGLKEHLQRSLLDAYRG